MPSEHALAERLPGLPLAGIRTWAAARRADLALGAVAIGILLPTASYRYGIDQAVYHYFGAGLLDGRVPYRDAFDIKPPGIYALYAVALGLLGRAQSSIRVFEIGCVLAVGWCVAHAARAGKARTDGVAGASAVLLASFYSARFGFWDTAQVELWEGAFVVAAYAALPLEPAPRRRLFLSGALAAVAILLKPSAAAAVLLLVVLSAIRGSQAGPARAERAARAVFSVLLFLTGLATPLVFVLAYFVAHGAWSPLLEWFRYMLHYAAAPADSSWVLVFGPETLVADGGLWYGIFVAIWLVGWSESRKQGDRAERRRAVEAGFLLVTAILGVVGQRRYLSYHAAVFGPFLALLAAAGLERGMAARPCAGAMAAVSLSLGSFLSAAPWLGAPGMNYRTYVVHAWLPFVLGRTSKAEFEQVFTGPFEYSYAAHAAVSAIVMGRKPEPGDRLHVGDFDPTTYVLTGLYSPSRFMIEVPITSPYLLSFEPGWAREHAQALLDHAPRFFVSHLNRPKQTAALMKRGYVPLATRGPLVLLEHGHGNRQVFAPELQTLLAGGAAHGVAGGMVPFEAEFGQGNNVSARAGGAEDAGTFEVTTRDRVCVRFTRFLGAKKTCAQIFVRSGSYTAFDDEGRDIATFELTRAAE